MRETLNEGMSFSIAIVRRLLRERSPARHGVALAATDDKYNAYFFGSCLGQKDTPMV